MVVYSSAPASSRAAADGGDGRALLADRDVDAAHLLLRVAGVPGALLVHDRVDGDGGLAGLAVADDQLALAAADRDHRVDGLDPGLQRLMTSWRSITPAACSSSGRRSSMSVISPSPSIGLPSASTVRPR